MIAILGALSVTAVVGVQSVQRRGNNEKGLDNLIGISNGLEQFKVDHLGRYPDIREALNGNQNVTCYNAQAQYVHDCADESVAFIQGFVDNFLLGKKYLPEVPVDPWTGSRYVYGRSADGEYYQIAGLWKNGDDDWEARVTDNLSKGFPLPSIVRSYDGPNFVVQRGEFLPYSPSALVLAAHVRNLQGSVTVTPALRSEPPFLRSGDLLTEGSEVTTGADGSLDIYFSDGSVSSLEPRSSLTLGNLEVAENNRDNLVTKIRLLLTSGRLWNKVARLSQGSQFEIETSSAIAGVRGTEFGVAVTTGATLFTLRSGRVEVLERLTDGADEDSVSDTGDNIGFVDSGADGLDDGTDFDDVTPVAWRTGVVGRTGAWSVTDTPARERTGGSGWETRHYRAVPLTNLLIPRILQVTAGPVITVEDPFTTLGLAAPQTLSADRILVTYRDPADGSEREISVELGALDTDGDGNYRLDLTAGGSYNDLTLRFEELDAGGEVESASAFSSPALDLTGTVTLSSGDINRGGNAGRAARRPRLTLFDPPDTVVVPRGAADTEETDAAVWIRLEGYDFALGNPDWIITGSPGNCAEGSGVVTTAFQGMPFNATLPPGAERGTCDLTLRLTLQDEDETVFTEEREDMFLQRGDVLRVNAEGRIEPVPTGEPPVTGAALGLPPRLTGIRSAVAGGNRARVTWTLDMRGHAFVRLELQREDGRAVLPVITDGDSDSAEITEATYGRSFTRGGDRPNPLVLVLTYQPPAGADGVPPAEDTMTARHNFFVGVPTILSIGFEGTVPTEATVGTPVTLPRVTVTDTTDDGGIDTDITAACGWTGGVVAGGVYTPAVAGPVTLVCQLPLGGADIAGSGYVAVDNGERIDNVNQISIAGLTVGAEVETLALDSTTCVPVGTRGAEWVVVGAQAGCWVLGNLGETCEAACGSLDQNTDADAALELDIRCDITSTTWDDSDSCTVCLGVAGELGLGLDAVDSCDSTSLSQAPYYNSVPLRCLTRTSATSSCTGSNPDRRRLCKCEQAL